ncbi:MAG: serpin family protein [Silvibacterium sp.]
MMKCLAAVMAFVMLGTGAPSRPGSSNPAQALAKPYAQFGFDALRELAAKHPDGNVFISPTSIAVALAMTSNGANGATRDAILATLHSDPHAFDTFNAANRALAQQMGTTTAVQLSMANALWLQQGFAVNPSFNQVLQANYNAQAQNLDFHNPASTQTINAWVAKHTNDRIPKLLDQIDPATVVILTNAIAFKGKWTLPFDPKETQSHTFKTPTGAREVPMMKHNAKYAYASADGLEAICLPYTDRTFAMYVVLPQDAARMQSFLQQLTPEAFTSLVTSLQPREGAIELPRFTIKYEASLNTLLAKLGMGIAFSSGANFKGINDTRPLQISEVRHASFLSIDEEGTEAAAATSVGIRTLAMRVEPPPFHMVVDHPFFVAIRDERNGQILFTGVVSEPVK